jgi:hypothetical protein
MLSAQPLAPHSGNVRWHRLMVNCNLIALVGTLRSRGGEKKFVE